MQTIADEPQRTGRTAQARELLLIDARPGAGSRVTRMLSPRGITVTCASSATQAREISERLAFDVVILHEHIPDSECLDVVHALVTDAFSPRVLVLIEQPDIGDIVEYMKAGAIDCLVEPVDDETLIAKVESAFDSITRRKQSELLMRPALKSKEYYELTESSSEKVRGIFHLIERYARAAPMPVLIMGETGVGKERAARTLHNRSARANMPFIPLNCAAFDHSLFESELFGHEKGAFTGANVRKRGLMELANGGTLFLDEIGDMPPGAQAKLLRTLEDRAFRRIGGNTVIHSDFWLISATNKDIEPRLDKGEFRPDLYYRLSALRLQIPPLRERLSDIPDLVKQICREMLGRNAEKVDFAPGVLEAFEHYRWPGNIRELRNVVERSLIVYQDYRIRLSEEFERFTREATPPALQMPEVCQACTIEKGGVFLDPIAGRTLKEIEIEAKRRAVQLTIEKSGGSITRTAASLGVSSRTISRILSGEFD